MELERANETAQRLAATLRPHCHRVTVAGSIRRRRPFVNDIDLVLIPKPEAALTIDSLLAGMGIVQLNGPKIKRLRLPTNTHIATIAVDIYLATPETWPTLLLIRTGSKQHNIMLCTLARTKGCQLKANGEGLFNSNGDRIAGDTEDSIFAALGLPYIEPSAREA